MSIIAVDIGGTKIRACIVDEKRRIINSVTIPTRAEAGKKQFLGEIDAVISQLMAKNKKASAIGVSIPGFPDRKGKMLFAGDQLRFLKGFNIKEYLEKKTGIRTFVENDAKCFALAEALHGAGRKSRIVVGIIWGSGIGSGIVIDKKLYRGADGSAGETGHILLKENAATPLCACGKRGCLEMLASGKSIERIYREKGGKKKDAEVADIFKSKEKAAKQAVGEAVHYLAVGISTLANILNPDMIVIGGGVSNLPLYKKLEKESKKYCIPEVAGKLRISKYRISDTAGVIGAAEVAFNSIRK